MPKKIITRERIFYIFEKSPKTLEDKLERDKRTETDSFGPIEVPNDCYYGAQTARSLLNFDIGSEKIPEPVIVAMALIKKAASIVNRKKNLIDKEIALAIGKSADEIMQGKLRANFPLSVWQTGSGTQTNMNINEVLANRSIELLGGKIGSKSPVHPNDHCNMGQSSNDTFPTAMHIAAVTDIVLKLIPALKKLSKIFGQKEKLWEDVVKIGRTHTQDATPLTLGQEVGAFKSQLEDCSKRIEDSLEGLFLLAQGGTAVGTGINTFKGFDREIASEIADLSKLPFKPAPNKFVSLATNDAYLHAHAAINTLAISLFKIANDIRFLASGPRSGLGELSLPENEPGSSIMPGKVNPTQCEALTMVCTRVYGNQSAIAFAASQGHFQLNVYKPLMAYSMHQSIELLTDGMNSFSEKCAMGMTANYSRIEELTNKSLMLVTALSPIIGYDKSAEIAKLAHKNGTTLKEEVLKMGIISNEEFDKIMNPKLMVASKETIS